MDQTSMEVVDQKSRVKQHLVKNLINMLVDMLPEELLKDLVGNILEKVEDLATKTENKYDDIIVKAMCGKIRDAFDIPDKE